MGAPGLFYNSKNAPDLRPTGKAMMHRDTSWHGRSRASHQHPIKPRPAAGPHPAAQPLLEQGSAGTIPGAKHPAHLRAAFLSSHQHKQRHFNTCTGPSHHSTSDQVTKRAASPNQGWQRAPRAAGTSPARGGIPGHTMTKGTRGEAATSGWVKRQRTGSWDNLHGRRH